MAEFACGSCGADNVAAFRRATIEIDAEVI